MMPRNLVNVPVLVVDAWPVLEWFYKRSPVVNRFTNMLESASRGEIHLCMSRLNLGEVYYSVVKKYDETAAGLLMRHLQALPIEVISVSDSHVDVAARLKGAHNISYADAFGAALSIERNAPLVTGDSDFLPLASANILSLHWLGV